MASKTMNDLCEVRESTLKQPASSLWPPSPPWTGQQVLHQTLSRGPARHVNTSEMMPCSRGQPSACDWPATQCQWTDAQEEAAGADGSTTLFQTWFSVANPKRKFPTSTWDGHRLGAAETCLSAASHNRKSVRICSIVRMQYKANRWCCA
jgi:hypothetical protein